MEKLSTAEGYQERAAFLSGEKIDLESIRRYYESQGRSKETLITVNRAIDNFTRDHNERFLADEGIYERKVSPENLEKIREMKKLNSALYHQGQAE